MRPLLILSESIWSRAREGWSIAREIVASLGASNRDCCDGSIHQQSDLQDTFGISALLLKDKHDPQSRRLNVP
jgi:hypothetical protein